MKSRLLNKRYLIASASTLVLGLVGVPAPVAAATHSPPSTHAVNPIQRTFPATPVGFNPLTANASQLQHYGFPPRPTGGSGLQLWVQAMRAAKHEVTKAPPVRANTTVTPNTSIGQVQTTWAGYDANSNQNGNEQFSEAQAQWVVPSVPANSQYSGYSIRDPMDAFWTGLGGGASDQYLAQAGVLTVSQSVASYYFFTETTDTQSTPVREGPTISPGNTAYVEVWYNGNYAEYFLENATTGSYQSFATYDYNVDRGSFECVAEYPSLSSPYLPNFGSMQYTGCNAVVSNTGYMQSMSAYNYYQYGDWVDYNGTTQRVQYPGALSGGSFPIYWQNYN